MRIATPFRGLPFPLAVLLHALSPAPSSAQVEVATAGPAARVTGVVFDSLRMRPMAGAAVWTESGRTVIADSTGAFVLDSLEEGEHVLGAADPSLDSLGVQITATARASLAPVPLTLASPSFRSLGTHLCGDVDAFPANHGILFGTVRDIATGTHVPDAVVDISWLRVEASRRRLDADIVAARPQTDSSGTWIVCGVPVDTTLQVRAFGGEYGTSGLAYLDIGETRIMRLDLAVSSESAVRGDAVVRGIVADENGRRLGGVSVSLDGTTSETRTNADGGYMLRNAPVGTRTLVVRRPGFAPFYASVLLTRVDTPFVRVQLSSARLLSTVAVRADRLTRTMADIERRRLSGFGYFIGADELEKRSDYSAVFRNIPGIEYAQATPRKTKGVLPGPMHEFKLLGSGKGIGDVTGALDNVSSCELAVFIDGNPATYDMLRAYPLDAFLAIEVFPRSSQVPAEYQIRISTGCGAVLAWTKRLG